MRLGIDLDGVTANWHKAVLDQLNMQYQMDLKPSDMKHWNFLDITPFKEWEQFWDWFKTFVGFSCLAPLPWSIDTLKFLHHIRRHEIVILTHRPDWAIPSTYRWLANNGIPTKEVHITEHKVNVPCDIYLDDSPEQLHRLYSYQGRGKVVRFERPWNMTIKPTWHASVRTWNDFRELVMADERG